MTTPARSHARDRAFSASVLLPTVGFMVLGIVTVLVMALIGLSQSGLVPGISRPPPTGVGKPKLQITPAPAPVPSRVRSPGGTEGAFPVTVDLRAIDQPSVFFRTPSVQGPDDTISGGVGSAPTVLPAVINEPATPAPSGPSPVTRPPQTHRPPPAQHGPPTSAGSPGEPGHGCAKDRVGTSMPEQCRRWCQQTYRDDDYRDDDRAMPDQCRKWCRGVLWSGRPDGDWRVWCTQPRHDSDTAANATVAGMTGSLSRGLRAQPAKAPAKAKPKPKAHAKPETKAESKAHAKPETKAESKAHAKPETKAESKAKAKPESKAKAKARQRPKPEPKPEPKHEASRPPKRPIRVAETTVNTRSQPQKPRLGASASD